MPLNKASCIPLVSMVPHGGQIRHYTAWYFWSDPTLHYVIFLVRSDTTLCGISRQIRHYTTWYLWSDQTLHYVVFLVRSKGCGQRNEACSPLRNHDWSDRRGIEPRPLYLLAKSLLCHQVKPIEQAIFFYFFKADWSALLVGC